MKYPTTSKALFLASRATVWFTFVAFLLFFSCATVEGKNYQIKRADLEYQIQLGTDFIVVEKILDDAGLKKEIWFNLAEPQHTEDVFDRTNWSSTITALVGVVPEMLTREKYVTCYFDRDQKLKKIDWWQYSRF